MRFGLKLIPGGILILVLVTSLFASALAQTCPITVYEGETVQLLPEGFDPDPEIGPAGMLLWSFSPPFNMTGAWETQKGQRGVFGFKVTVSDGELTDVENSCVEVLPNNRPPVLEPVPEVIVPLGQDANIPVSCSDPDGDMVNIEYEFRGYPVAYIYYDQPGDYSLRVICSDGFGGVTSQQTMLHVLEPEPIGQETGPIYIAQPVVEDEPQPVEINIPIPLPIPVDDQPVEADQETEQPVIIELPDTGACPTGYEEVIEVVQVPETVCPPVTTQPIEVVQAPVQICPPVTTQPIEVVQAPLQICPTQPVQPVVQQPIEVVMPQPVAEPVCPTVQPTRYDVVEIVQAPVPCPVVQPRTEVVEIIMPQQVQECPPVKPEVIHTIELVDRPVQKVVCKAIQPPKVEPVKKQVQQQTQQIEMVVEQPKTKTFKIVLEDQPKTKRLKTAMERKLEIQGFYEAPCDCDESQSQGSTSCEGSVTYTI